MSPDSISSSYCQTPFVLKAAISSVGHTLLYSTPQCGLMLGPVTLDDEGTASIQATSLLDPLSTTPDIIHPEGIAAISCIPEKRLFTAGHSGTLLAWNYQEGAWSIEHRQPLNLSQNTVTALEYLNEHQVLFAQSNGVLGRWDIRTQTIDTCETPHRLPVKTLSPYTADRHSFWVGVNSDSQGMIQRLQVEPSLSWDSATLFSTERHIHHLLGGFKDHSFLAVHDTTIALYQGKECMRTWYEPLQSVSSLLRLNDERFIAAGKDGIIWGFDISFPYSLKHINVSQDIGSLVSLNNEDVVVFTQNFGMGVESLQEILQAPIPKPKIVLDYRTLKSWTCGGELQDITVLANTFYSKISSAHHCAPVPQPVVIKEYREPEHARKEALFLAQLPHKHIVRLLGLRKDGNNLSLMLERCKSSLSDCLSKVKNTLSSAKRFKIARQTAEALAFMHFKDILHRDLKSPNILLDDHDDVKLCDLALSACEGHLSSRPVPMKQVTGTPPWMAPELLLEDEQAVHVPPYSKASDVYALGMTFWELVSGGKHPAEELKNTSGKYDTQLFRRKIKEEWRPTIPPHCEEGFRELIQQCWAQDPDERPSALEVVQKIDHLERSLCRKRKSSSEVELSQPTDSDSNPETKKSGRTGSPDPTKGLSLS